MRPIGGLLACLAVAASLAATEGFETGTGIWTPQPPAQGSVAWHRVTVPACVTPHSGLACLYFGRDGSCNYDDGQVKDASVVSAPVLLNNSADAFISFWELYQVESEDPACFDKLYLERSSDGVTWLTLADLSVGADPPGGAPSLGLASGGGVGGPALWQYHSIDLSLFYGSVLYLRFRFVSGATLAGNNLCWPADASYDNFLGYALDDISYGEAEPTLGLLKSVAPAVAAPGQTFTFSLMATNNAASPAAANLWDTLPSGAVFVSSSPAPSIQLGPLLAWNLPSAATGAAQTVRMLVQAPASAVPPVDWINVAAGVSSLDPSTVAESNGAWARIRPPGLSVRKTASATDVTSGDAVAFSITVENATASSQTVQVLEQLPVGMLVQPPSGAVNPAFDAGSSSWSNIQLAPGDLRIFSVLGPLVGLDGQIVVNTVLLRQGGATVASATASVVVHAPVQPHIWIKALYPNPAPGGGGLPDHAVLVYETNQDMPVSVDYFTVAGEKVRHFDTNGSKGVHSLEWDLCNGSGRHVASGVYVVRVYSDASTDPLPQAFGYQAVLR